MKSQHNLILGLQKYLKSVCLQMCGLYCEIQYIKSLHSIAHTYVPVCVCIVYTHTQVSTVKQLKQIYVYSLRLSVQCEFVDLRMSDIYVCQDVNLVCMACCQHINQTLHMYMYIFTRINSLITCVSVFSFSLKKL